MPLFTIIVPTYNRPTLLAEALESVRNQTFRDLECIVVEDAPPTSRAVVPPDSRFRLIRHESNRGSAAARNTGLEHATGDYVTFLDDDDVLTPDRLTLVLPLLGSELVVVCGRAGMLLGVPARYRNLQGHVFDRIVDDYPPHTGQTVAPRALVPRFDERYTALEDVEWWLRLSHALPVRSTPEIGYRTRHHEGTRHGNGAEARARCSRLVLGDYGEYFRSHRRARAFRLDRLARLEAGLGNKTAARSAAWRSVITLPKPRSLYLALGLPSRSTGIRAGEQSV